MQETSVLMKNYTNTQNVIHRQNGSLCDTKRLKTIWYVMYRTHDFWSKLQLMQDLQLQH